MPKGCSRVQWGSTFRSLYVRAPEQHNRCSVIRRLQICDPVCGWDSMTAHLAWPALGGQHWPTITQRDANRRRHLLDDVSWQLASSSKSNKLCNYAKLALIRKDAVARCMSQTKHVVVHTITNKTGQQTRINTQTDLFSIQFMPPKTAGKKMAWA